MNTLTCTLPGGYIDQTGQRHQRINLCPLNGEAEALVADLPAGPALVSQLLAASIAAIGPYPGSLELAQQLLVADRQYLLLRLRAATYGEQIRAVLQCAQPTCGHKMDLMFTVDDIPVEPMAQLHATYQHTLSAAACTALDLAVGEETQTITFRLPTGEDQEALVPLIRAGRDQEAAYLLLQRCVQWPEVIVPATAWPTTLPALVCTEIEDSMAAVAPTIELTMEGICPECRQPFAVPFDLESFVLQELRTSLDVLTREVHYLAFHYHWSEREILQMPRTKRQRYLHLLAEEMEKLQYAT